MYLSCTQAQKNHVECVSALLCFPAVTDLRDSEGRTAVMWAAQRGNYNALQAMLEKGLSASTADASGATGNDHPPTPHTHCVHTHTHTLYTHHTHTPHSSACCFTLRPCQLCAATSAGKYPLPLYNHPTHSMSLYNHPTHSMSLYNHPTQHVRI